MNGSSKRGKHLEPYKWKPGDIPNPAGRPKGSRNRLAEKLISDFCTHWEEHGAEAIDWLFKNNKLHYVKIGTHLIPREFVMKESSLSDLSDAQVSQMLEYLNEQMGKNAKVINVEPVSDTDRVSAAPEEE
jgi:hypothetical protein